MAASYNEALYLYKDGKLEEALNTVNEFIQEHPDHEKAKFLKAVIMRRLGQLKEAKELFEELGFTELAEAIPDPVETQEIENEIEEIKEVLAEEPSEEIQPEEAQQVEDLFPFRILRVRIFGEFYVAKEHFAAFVGKNISFVNETDDEIQIKAEGELFLSCFKITGGNIMRAKGQGQLAIIRGNEQFITKTETEEDVVYQESPEISWTKLQ